MSKYKKVNESLVFKSFLQMGWVLIGTDMVITLSEQSFTIWCLLMNLSQATFCCDLFVDLRDE